MLALLTHVSSYTLEAEVLFPGIRTSSEDNTSLVRFSSKFLYNVKESYCGIKDTENEMFVA